MRSRIRHMMYTGVRGVGLWGALTLHVLQPVRTFGLLARLLRANTCDDGDGTGRSPTRRPVGLGLALARFASGSVAGT